MQKDKDTFWKEYNKHGTVPSEWSLNHPPEERNEFWILPPLVIFEALVHFVHTNQKITIPYGWEPVNYYQKNGTGVRGANLDKERPTMEDALLKLTTVIHRKYNHRQNKIDDPNNLKSTVHYTPSIVSKNESIARNEEQSCIKTKNIKSLEVSMKKDVNKGEKMQLRIRHMIKILKQSIQDLALATANIKIDIENFYSNILVKARYDSIEAYEQHKDNNEESLLNDLFENSKEEIALAIQKEKKEKLAFDIAQKKAALLEITYKNRNNNDINMSIITNPLSQENDTESNTVNSRRSESAGGNNHSTTSGTTASNETAFNVEEYKFQKGSKLLTIYTNLIAGDSVGKNALPEFCPESQATLSHDIIELAKTSSTAIATNDIKTWKATCVTKSHKVKGNFMASIRNLRTGVVVIEPLQTNKDCMVIQKRSKDRKLIYQQECQKDLTNYTQHKKEYYEEHRYSLYEQTLQELATSQAKEHRSLKINQAKIPNIKQDEVKILHNIKTSELSFLIQLFIMIGPACASITKWGDFSSNEEMMKRLTSNLRGHKRFKDMGTDRIKIGTVIVAKPYSRLLEMAKFLATKLSHIIADMTLGLKYKFFALVIHRKTKYITQNHIMKNRLMNLTTGIMDILMSKPHDMAAIEKINIVTELAVKNVLERFKRRDKAIRTEQQALKSPTPGSTAIEASVTTSKNKEAAKARATTTKKQH